MVRKSGQQELETAATLSQSESRKPCVLLLSFLSELSPHCSQGPKLPTPVNIVKAISSWCAPEPGLPGDSNFVKVTVNPIHRSHILVNLRIWNAFFCYVSSWGTQLVTVTKGHHREAVEGRFHRLFTDPYSKELWIWCSLVSEESHIPSCFHTSLYPTSGTSQGTQLMTRKSCC